MKYKKTPEEIREHLNDSIDFINSSCELFDSGKEHEALRLATTIRVLIHDTKNSTSLLQQLGIKGKISYWDSSLEYDPRNLANHLGLICLQANRTETGMSSRYIPGFNFSRIPPGNWQGFQYWWNSQIVLTDTKKNVFHRKDLILNTSNKDGGAHVDGELPTDYANLTRANTAGWSQVKNGVEMPFDNNIVYPCIRQIAFEVLETLNVVFPELFAPTSNQR